jgi:hypothetical protein
MLCGSSACCSGSAGVRNCLLAGKCAQCRRATSSRVDTSWDGTGERCANLLVAASGLGSWLDRAVLLQRAAQLGKQQCGYTGALLQQIGEIAVQAELYLPAVSRSQRLADRCLQEAPVRRPPRLGGKLAMQIVVGTTLDIIP